jgi:membrane-associated protease RseP (regulator of RpoE activity)
MRLSSHPHFNDKGNTMRLFRYSLLGLILAANVSMADDKQSLEAVVANENFFSSSFVESKPSNAKRIVSDAAPKIYAGTDKIADKHRMEERGFELIGYSDFKAGSVAPELALPQAQKVHAELVLVYSERADQVSASAKIQQLREAKKTGQAPVEAGASYAYFASYWAKLAKPSLGVHVKVPEKDDDAEGLKVLVVLDGSAAEKAGLLKDDLLISIGDVQLLTVTDLSKAVNQYSGRTVDMAYVRNRMHQESKVSFD